MTKPQTELPRPVEVSRIQPTGSSETILADPDECAMVAKRLGLPAIFSLEADLVLSRWRRGGVKVAGLIEAEIEQICVVTLDPFRATVSDSIERYFLPHAGPTEEEADIESFDGDVIELGELVVESLSLALDPYPRKPGAEFNEVSDDSTPANGNSEPSPFAALADLKSPKR